MSSRWGSSHVVLFRAGHLPVAIRERDEEVCVRIVDLVMTLMICIGLSRESWKVSITWREEKGTMGDSQRKASNGIDV